MKQLKRLLAGGIVIIIFMSMFSSCIHKSGRYSGEYSEYNGTYVGADALGREMLYDTSIGSIREDRYVGIFYFLWQGQHGTVGPYDNNKIFTSNPESVKSEKAWLKAGGGAQGAHHFWGEPMFGYYTSDDTWVMRKHVQMLTDAQVDFLVFDTTNGYTYDEQVIKLLEILDEYSKLGWPVPKIVCYTNSNSGVTMTKLYENIYKKMPEYSQCH